jgi:hypothetical protein
VIQKIENVFETILFFLLTGLFYFLVMVNVPLFGDLHGLIVMNELPIHSFNGLVMDSLFGSAVVYVFLGIMMMSWEPLFTPAMMAVLWALTYFVIWIDTVLSLSIETRKFNFLGVFGLGLIFIFFFFFILNQLGFGHEKHKVKSQWKLDAVYYWILGVMTSYFTISGVLIFNSFYHQETNLPLATGIMVVCFLNYLLCLFLRKSVGKEIDFFSNAGRIVFTLWSAALILVWIGRKWIA